MPRGSSPPTRLTPPLSSQARLQMQISPSPLTAALAGAFSALTWPWLWSRFGQAGSEGSTELILGTLLLVALPAHAFVLGFGHRASVAPGQLDRVLLKRVGAWLGAAGATAVLTSAQALF